MQYGTLLASIDLGSNSFRLEIGRLEQGHIQRIEYLKETVRQGNGLDAERNLSFDAMQRGWECLARFAERISGFKKFQVRAVATQTLREARNRDVFLARSQQILGFPIDVISGREEARLIYLGVSHLLPQSDERRLVIDIGGRSTEMILGQGLQPSVTESYRVGSVAWSMKYFPDGLFTADAFKRAEIAASAVLDEAQQAFAPQHWESAYGSSGTFGAVADILTASGFEPGWVTTENLDWLLDRLLKAQSAERLKLEGIKEDRRAVIGGGLSVLRSVFSQLNIHRMTVAQGALRHGALYDLLDREHNETDVRSATVKRLAQKFNVDSDQANRVGCTAQALFGQLQTGVAPSGYQRFLRKLGWAAQLHEVGQRISHSDYHKHGAYILDHADAAGFAQPELHRLSLLVLGHRGKLRKIEANLTDMDFVRQLICLRLAVILCHARRDPDLKSINLSMPGNEIHMQCSEQWATQFPQSFHLLREEVAAWQKMPIGLNLVAT